MGLWITRHVGRTVSSLLVCAGALILSSQALATPLIPGTTVTATPTGSPVGAALIADSAPQPFASVDGTSFSGTLRTQVWNNDAGNPFGPNALTFTFVLTNNGPDSLERLVAINYFGYLTDVSTNNVLVPGALPNAVDRSLNEKVVGFDWTGLGGVSPGGNSAMLVLHTNALQHVAVINSIINGSVATVPSFGPAPIPEPATLALAGIAGLGLIMRRRSK